MNLSQSRDLIFTATIFIAIGGKAKRPTSYIKTKHHPRFKSTRADIYIYFNYNLKIRVPTTTSSKF